MPGKISFLRCSAVTKQTTLLKMGDALHDVVEVGIEKQTKAFTTALRATVIDVYSRIMMDTPVDTGRARGNWFFTKDRPTSKRDEQARTSYRRINELTRGAARIKFGTRYYLTNNLPYIETLEFGNYPKNPKRGTRNPRTGAMEIRSRRGFSKQAPAGMVRINLNRFNRILQKNVRANKVP